MQIVACREQYGKFCYSFICERLFLLVFGKNVTLIMRIYIANDEAPSAAAYVTLSFSEIRRAFAL